MHASQTGQHGNPVALARALGGANGSVGSWNWYGGEVA